MWNWDANEPYESPSRHFHPGEGPSRGLLCDCENFTKFPAQERCSARRNKLSNVMCILLINSCLSFKIWSFKFWIFHNFYNEYIFEAFEEQGNQLKIWKILNIWICLPLKREVSLNAKLIPQKGDFLLHTPSPGKTKSGLALLGPLEAPNLEVKRFNSHHTIYNIFFETLLYAIIKKTHWMMPQIAAI